MPTLDLSHFNLHKTNTFKPFSLMFYLLVIFINSAHATGNTISQISLKTVHNTYIVAEDNGGQNVNSDRQTPSYWEKFHLIDTNGGNLVSGDEVLIRTDTNYYFKAEAGGGDNLNAEATVPGTWETYIIVKPSDSPGSPSFIRNHDKISLQSSNGHYVQAASNGGANVEATEIGCNKDPSCSWEIFEIQMFGITEITTPLAGNCLTNSSNNNVHVGICGNSNQQWELTTDNTIKLQNTGLCLDRNSNNAFTQTCNINADSQKWGYVDGEIRTTDVNPKCLDVENSSIINGTNVKVANCTHGLNQKWFVMY